MFDETKLLKALETEGVKLAPAVLQRVIRRLTNPDGCAQCGARTNVAKENMLGALVTICCGHLIANAPMKEKKQ